MVHRVQPSSQGVPVFFSWTNIEKDNIMYSKRIARGSPLALLCLLAEVYILIGPFFTVGFQQANLHNVGLRKSVSLFYRFCSLCLSHCPAINRNSAEISLAVKASCGQSLTLACLLAQCKLPCRNIPLGLKNWTLFYSVCIISFVMFFCSFFTLP